VYLRVYTCIYASLLYILRLRKGGAKDPSILRKVLNYLWMRVNPEARSRLFLPVSLGEG